MPRCPSPGILGKVDDTVSCLRRLGGRGLQSPRGRSRLGNNPNRDTSGADPHRPGLGMGKAHSHSNAPERKRFPHRTQFII